MRRLLFAGVAGAALLAGVTGADANGLTFTWTGLGNGTSYGKGDNWSLSTNPSATPVDPPLAGDTAIITSGTPTVTSKGRSALVVDVSGGTLGLANGSTFFVTNKLILRDAGVLDINVELVKGISAASTLTANAVEISGTAAAHGLGKLTAQGWIDQSGGSVSQLTINTPSYTQSGGSLSAFVTTNTYDLTSAAATSSGATIVASDAFNLRPDSGTAIVDAKLSGTADLVKSGDSTVVLTNSDNDFSGSVTIDGGVLETRNGNALPDGSAVSIADVPGATLLLTDSETIGSLSGGGTVTIADGQTLTMGDDSDTSYLGTMGGEAAGLVKQGSGTLTLGGEIMLGGLSVTGGTLQIGTGTSTNTASFESAEIGAGSTVHVAKNATLTIRIPNNIANYGHLINDGTVNDDLDNNSTFDNNGAYNANVASNSSDINNHSGGVWTGKVLTNGGTINNMDGARWTGDVASNDGQINNDAGAVWTGDVTTNAGGVSNNGTWNGNVLGAYSQISNGTGAHWVGNVVGNSNAIFNWQGGTWSGHVLANGENVPAGQIDNYGTWINGTVEGNIGMILNLDGSWTGDVLANSDFISNNTNDSNVNPAGINHAHWTGDIHGNSGTITNDLGGTWTGAVLGNKATINNHGTWLGGTVSGNGINGGPGGLGANGFIDNSATGIWTGDIAANYGWVYNQGGTWNGDVLSNKGQVWNDNAPGEVGTGHWIGDVVGNSSTIFNAGGGDWAGDVLANSLPGYISNDVGGAWHGGVSGNAGTIENLGVWTGDLAGSSRRIYNEGVWHGDVLAADSNHSGNTGTIYNADSDATWDGDVKGNAGTIDNRGGLWDGDVLANTGTILNRAATWDGALTGASIWTGNVLSNAGTINTYDVWNGSFASAGTVNAMGQINGAFVNDGTLHLTGSLSGITTLSNNGILDMRGTDAGQTLTATTVIFGPESTYDVNVDSGGNADKVIATSATLDGVVHVSAKVTAGNYNYMTPYTILSAGSISGLFGGVTTDLVFLDPRLDYLTPGSVKLNLVRNDTGFAEAGVTANQKSTAIGAQSLGAGNPIYDAILWLNADEAGQAFDALSGEAYSSTESAALQAASLIAETATDRIDQAFDAVGGGEGSVSGYVEGPSLVSSPSLSSGIWGQFYGAHGSTAVTSSLAGVESTTGGFVAGIDGMLEDWRLGVMVQGGATGTVVAGRDSSSTSVDYGLGVYGGRQWGDTRLSLGATFTRHDINANREVAFPGFSDRLTANYSAGTSQAFARLSHKFDLGAVALTPYASLGYVSHATDGFTESGGAAALTSTPDVIDATFTTLGFGVDRQFAVGDEMLLTARGAVGWQHAFAEAPGTMHTLAGGTSFAVLGVPIVADMFVLSAGLNLDVSATTTLDFSYDGQIGGGAQTHALKATWSSRF